jgi:hypothetical protein
MGYPSQVLEISGNRICANEDFFSERDKVTSAVREREQQEAELQKQKAETEKQIEQQFGDLKL